MVMIAIVLRADIRSLLVRCMRTNGEVRVITPIARRFRPGERIMITYTGTMTHSIPPQITAISIHCMQNQPHPPYPPHPPQLLPREIRATILQRRRESLVVRDAHNVQLIVHYRYAHHFCVGQKIIIRHDSVVMNHPLEINATDITPVC